MSESAIGSVSAVCQNSVAALNQTVGDMDAAQMNEVTTSVLSTTVGGMNGNAYSQTQDVSEIAIIIDMDTRTRREFWG